MIDSLQGASDLDREVSLTSLVLSRILHTDFPVGDSSILFSDDSRD